MDDWRALRLAVQSAILGLGSLAGIVVLCWNYPVLVPLKYPVVACVILVAVGVAVALRKPSPAIGLRRREEFVFFLASAAVLVSGLTFLIGLGLQTVSSQWGWAMILLCALIFLYALSISLLARGVLIGRRVYYQSHCSRCLYDLSAIESGTCPECGRIVTPFETDPS